MMEMQEQQENAWKQQEKENRIKMLKTDRSAAEMRAMRDMSVEAKIISNEAFDRELDRANEVFDAEAEFRQTRDPNRLNNINQTIQYALRDQERAGDVGHVMEMEMNDFGSPEGSLQPASRRGRSSSSRPGDPSSSSGGPPPPPPPSTGATMSGKVLGAVAAGGRGAWEALKFGGEAFGAVSSLVGDVVDTGMKIY
jgi:hypothetical protein